MVETRGVVGLAALGTGLAAWALTRQTTCIHIMCARHRQRRGKRLAKERLE